MVDAQAAPPLPQLIPPRSRELIDVVPGGAVTVNLTFAAKQFVPEKKTATSSVDRIIFQSAST